MGCYLIFMVTVRFLLVSFATSIGIIVILRIFLNGEINALLTVTLSLLVGVLIAIPLTSKYLYEERRKMQGEGYIEHIVIRGRGRETNDSIRNRWWN